MNAALLSRCKVFRLEALAEAALVAILERALADASAGLGGDESPPTPRRSAPSRGRARRRAPRAQRRSRSPPSARRAAQTRITTRDARGAEAKAPLLYDKAGEEHYNVISAFIKSMRGSDPDAAVYWMMRMLEAGEDPLFVLRRMVIFASEDVGNADPRALVVVAAPTPRSGARHARGHLPAGAGGALPGVRAQVERGEERLAARARRSSSEHGALPVPMKLRNAVTKLMKRGLRRRLQVPARLRGRRRPGRDVPARRARGRAASTSRPSAARRPRIRARARGAPRRAAAAARRRRDESGSHARGAGVRAAPPPR